jgi:hypothetical protein
MSGVTGIAVLIGRSVAGCLGVILIYSALFLYKEEEGGLENRIEQCGRKSVICTLTRFRERPLF